jgi:hypothetical protein
MVKKKNETKNTKMMETMMKLDIDGQKREEKMNINIVKMSVKMTTMMMIKR